ncbi:MAG: hypothetical protein LC777_06330, partial [Actinobacteria bacterium]|nr:hypothetical protein [Actinomycetota bacterium]
GWLGRARRLLEDLEPGAEHGWLWVHEAEKLLFANETESARELARRASTLTRSRGLSLRTTDESQVGLIDHHLSWEGSSGRERRRVKAQT